MTSIRIAERQGDAWQKSWEARGAKAKRTDSIEKRRIELSQLAPAGTSVWFNARPMIPNNISFGSGGKDVNVVKPASANIYEQTILDNTAELSAEEKLAFMALTGTEILNVVRNIEMTPLSMVQNKNTLDSSDISKSTSPNENIKTQETNTGYVDSKTNPNENVKIEINKNTGEIQIGVPINDQPALNNPSNSSTNSTTQQTVVKPPESKPDSLVPDAVVVQSPRPPHKILSFTPTSAKRGSKITVTHQNCDNAPTGSKFLLTGNGKATNTIGPQKPNGSNVFVSFKTATSHGISVGQEVEVTGIQPAIYNGTWTAQKGTSGATLVLDIRKDNRIKPKQTPPPITVGGTVSFSAQEIEIVRVDFSKKTSKTTFSFNIPSSAIIGAQYRVKVTINNVSAISSGAITVASS